MYHLTFILGKGYTQNRNILRRLSKTSVFRDFRAELTFRDCSASGSKAQMIVFDGAKKGTKIRCSLFKIPKKKQLKKETNFPVRSLPCLQHCITSSICRRGRISTSHFPARCAKVALVKSNNPSRSGRGSDSWKVASSSQTTSFIKSRA